MVVQLNLREAKLNQVVDAAPVVSTGLVIPDQNRNVLIPSVFLTGTRFLVVAGARQSFNISNANYEQVVSATYSSSLATIKNIAVAKSIVLVTVMTKVLAIAVIKSISCSSAATLTKEIGRSISATVSSAATLTKQLAQSVVISVTQAFSASLNKAYSVGQVISATLSSSLSLGRGIDLTKNFTASFSTSMVRGIGKTISATSSSVLNLVRDIGKSLAANASFSLTTPKAISVVKNFTASSLASLEAGRLYLKTITASVSPALTIAFGLFKTIGASVGTSATLIRGVGKTLSATLSSTMSLAKSVALTISATASSLVTTALGRFKTISATVSSNLTLQSVITRLVFEITNIIYAMALVRKIILPAPDRLAEAEEDRTLAATDLGRIISRASQTRKIYFVRNSVVRNQFSPKVANETQYFTFNFGAVLATGETISSATVSYSAPPGSFVNSNTLVLTGSPVIEGSDVSQLIGAGRSLDVYILTCRIVTSSGQSFDLSGTLNIT